MDADPCAMAAWFALEKLRAGLARARGTEPTAGALSLEWVAIAIVLVTAALALAAFLTGKLSTLEHKIPSSSGS